MAVKSTRSKEDMVYVKQGTRKGSFTKFVWDNMGPDKNGWEIDPERNTEPGKTINLFSKASAPKADAAKAQVSKEQQFKDLVAQGQGFEKDGKFAEAMAKYGAALAIKTTKPLTDAMARLEAAMSEQMKTAIEGEKATDIDPAVEEADTLFAEGNYEVALQLYEGAENQTDAHVIARIDACKAAILGL